MSGGGCLEALQQQAGAFGVDGVVGDAQGDLGEGDLDGAETGEHREGERGLGGGGAGVAGRRARRVMVVAELLAAESEGAAAMAGGVKMRAAELRIGDDGIWLHETGSLVDGLMEKAQRERWAFLYFLLTTSSIPSGR
jgi:hypothetical protein